MDKNRIKLTESQLRQVIKESVKNILREEDERLGFSDETINRIEKCKELLGCDNFINAITGYLGELQINKILDSIEQTYNINNEEEY